jgi:hypothetical protein
MSDLFAWFQNYLNLSKLTAVTVPGMVVAFALILVLGPVPCQDNKACPFCASTLKPIADASATVTGGGSSQTSGASADDKSSKGNTSNKSPTTKASGAKQTKIAFIEVKSASWGDDEKLTKKEGTVESAIGDKNRAIENACKNVPQGAYAYTRRWFDGKSDPEFAVAETNDENQGKTFIPFSELNSYINSCKGQLDSATAILRKKNPPVTPPTQSSLAALNKSLDDLQDAANAADPSTASTTWVHVLRGTWGEAGVTKAADSQFPSLDDLTGGPYTQVLEKIDEQACSSIPRGIVPSSLIVLSDDGSKKDVTDEVKKANKQAQDLVRVSALLKDLNSCNADLQIVIAGLARAQSSLSSIVTQNTTDLGTLSGNLLSNQQAGERLVASDLQDKVKHKTTSLVAAQQELKAMQNASAAVQSLQTSVQGMLNQLNNPTTSATKSNAVEDVFQAIEQNLLKFLLFSLIVGQILDPLQRGAISFFGPRRSFFGAFNKVYGQWGDGEFRYGDRRLEPWVSNDAQGTIDSRADQGRDGSPPSEVAQALLRPNAAGRTFRVDRNIYDRNYAIGAGFITQNEAQIIEDDYFTQSQLTSGLMLPMLLLSVCLAIRFICCSASASQPDNRLMSVLLSSAAITFGVVLGVLLMVVTLLVGSAKYWKVFRDGITTARHGFNEARARGKERKKSRESWTSKTANKSDDPYDSLKSEQKHGEPLEIEARVSSSFSMGRLLFMSIIFIAFVALWVSATIILNLPKDYQGITSGQLAVAAMPAMTLGLLWIGGLDRLHKYYSELEARIAGNILRLQKNTEDKFIDLMSDKVAACALKEKADTLIKARQSLANCLKDIPCDDKTKDVVTGQDKSLDAVEADSSAKPTNPADQHAGSVAPPLSAADSTGDEATPE